MHTQNLVQRLEDNQTIDDAALKYLIESDNASVTLARAADSVRRRIYRDDVYIRGLIEISNRCRNNCYYCGIRAGNTDLERYHLSKEQILECSRHGYDLGYRTFVLQGGEDPAHSDDFLISVVKSIKTEHPDCAVTLSVGERPFESYRALREAGTDRYLLRHETASEDHYRKLHPGSMSLKYRKECLWEIKRLGFQVGSGFMVGSPYQTTDNIIEDLRFLQELQPDMIGIGPFLHHADTPFAEFPDGNLETTLRLISILRLMFPNALIPATTALATIDPKGRERGLAAGANVVMPNLSPTEIRSLYTLYDNKICTGEEAAEGLDRLKEQVKNAGYEVVTARGDVRKSPRSEA